MKLRFTKMHGAGNDFIVIDGVRQRVQLSASQRRGLANRNFGIGADQILLVEAADDLPGIDFRYRIFNSDGGEVEQCGNGARCFARFVVDQRLTDKRVIRVATQAGIIEPRIEADGRVTVDMGAPVFDPQAVPFLAEGLVPQFLGDDTVWPLEIDGVACPISVLSMGNPHAVQFVEDLDTAPVGSEGPRIERCDRFPARVNAGFAQRLSGNSLRLRVWERGVGETLACGTGACAAAVTGIRRRLVCSPVEVHTQGGPLTIAWNGGSVLMTGPAATVFEGEIDLAALSSMDPE
jgi:diaminopimelate epimerase